MSELRLKSTGTIKLFENDNTSSVTIASPASLGADRTITLPDASVTLASGTMLATDGDGSSLTGLTAGQIPNLAASKITSGTIDTARLGTGTASSSTVLYGDQTYKAEPGGGKVLQVVTNTNIVEQSTNSTSFQDSNAAVTITPASSSNKILIIGMIPCGSYKNSGTASTAARIDIGLFRGDSGGTQLTLFEMGFSYTPSSSGTTYSMAGSNCISYLDSPSTTSATEYMVCFKSVASGFNAYMQWALSGTDAMTTMTAIEIEG